MLSSWEYNLIKNISYLENTMNLSDILNEIGNKNEKLVLNDRFKTISYVEKERYENEVGEYVEPQFRHICTTGNSPKFILASVNTLYSAGKIIDQYPKCTKEVYGVIGSDCEVLPERVTAIKINKDKSILDLTNKILRRLNIEMIDEVLDDANNRHMNLYLLVMRECNEA